MLDGGVKEAVTVNASGVALVEDDGLYPWAKAALGSQFLVQVWCRRQFRHHQRKESIRHL